MNAPTQTAASACASGERPVLAIRGLVHRWPRVPSPAFEVPSLTLHAGESLFIHGPSGCGKSTLLSLICGIAVAAEGELRVLGQDWRGLGGGRRDAWRADHIGCVFQQFNLLPFLNALDNATLPARFSRMRRLACEARGGVQAEATRLLRHMGLDDEAMRRPSNRLSVGQQQRVAVARALLGSPALVVADEPTSALDEDSCVAFLQTLKAACADARSALVFVSHDRRLTSACDRSLAWHALTGGSP